MDGHASHAARSPLTSQRVPKQRANVASRRVNHAPAFSAAGESITTMRGSSGLGPGGQGDVGKTRRGSIRHAVRKIFGKSSRDNAAPSSPQVSAPIAGPISRHAYHRSEPAPAYPPQLLPEVPLPHQQDDIVPQTVLTSHIRAKTSSPYAVSFPKSVMLKPMDLGNPFVPHAQMKRRKTMPNTGVPLRDAADAAASVPVPVPTGQIKNYPDVLDDRHAMRAMSQIKENRRKSRSTDDLVSNVADFSSPTQRSSEMRHWRESFRPDVLRASGFTTGTNGAATPRQVSTERDGHIPVVLATDTFESARGSLSSRDSPRQSQDSSSMGMDDSRPPSPVDLSFDLEQRVLKLEAGLNNFQRSLARLTADRNRRTIVLRSDMTTRRSSNDMRTPSMLADTLVDSLEPSTYEYGYGRTIRPSASLSPPPLLQSRKRYDEEPDEPLTPRSDHYADSVRLPTPPHTRSPGHPFPSSFPASLPPSSVDSPRQQQQYTFHSVYQMLSDERSARQKLEQHLNHLQREISHLHAQVNVTSSSSSSQQQQQQQRPSDRNSNYMLVGSSARLQQLLQETEEAHISTKHTSSDRSPGEEASALPVTSRFSGSESEVGLNLEYDEGQTPYGAYLTPREERSAQSLAGRLVVKDVVVDDDYHDDDLDLDCMF